MILKKILFYTGIATGILLIALFTFLYPFSRFFFHSESRLFDDRLAIITGAGNSGLLVTDSAVVVIDTKLWKNAKKLHQLAIEKAGSKKIIVINTHFHGDHTDGNDLYKGSEIIAGNYEKEFLIGKMKPEKMPAIFVADSMIMDLGDETVGLYNMGQGHTFSDLVVYLKNRRVLFTGDLVFNHINPALIREDGTDIEKWKNLLPELIHRFNATTYVPGHGEPGNQEMVTSLYRYFQDMQQAAIHPEMAKELVKKYARWMKMPFMSSPEKTVALIRETAGK